MGSGTPYYIVKARYSAILAYQEVCHKLRIRLDISIIRSIEESEGDGGYGCVKIMYLLFPKRIWTALRL